MRKQFVRFLLFFWSFHFLLPYIYQLIYGKVNIYSDVDSELGLWINSIVIVLVIFVLYCFRIPYFEKIKPLYNYAKIHYFISLLLLILRFILGGGYSGLVAGSSNGAFISFLSLFFNVQSSFYFVFFFQKELKSVNLYVLSYIIALTMLGSRSAIIALLLLFLFFPLYENSEKWMGTMKKSLIVLCFFAPLLFVLGTLVRTEISFDFISKLLVGRISMVEISSIPLNAKEDYSYDAALFEEKYSIPNQVEQSINVLTPIDLFPYDVSPNQYYRSIFLGYSEDFVQNNYMSMNMTFPVYWVMLSNYFCGIILSITLLLLLFYVWVRNRNSAYIVTLMLCSLYEILYFFDFVMIMQKILYVTLSFITLILVEHFCSSVVYTYTKYTK